MDAWLKAHVALLMPGLAPSLYAAGTDNWRLARTRDGLVLTILAIREGLRVLRVLDIPITPHPQYLRQTRCQQPYTSSCQGKNFEGLALHLIAWVPEIGIGGK